MSSKILAQQNTKGILKEFDLRYTACRSEILDLLNQKAVALSHADIEKNVGAAFDRVTVYRTLKTFVEKGLIHKVLDDEGGSKYALCSEACHRSDRHHHHDHVHFKCLECGETSCLEGITIPAISLPKGYIFEEANLLVNGVCKKCNTGS